MPFAPINLNPNIQAQLGAFAASNNFPDLYKGYNWGNDTHLNGFPDILSLEIQLSENDLNYGVTLKDVQEVAAWGNLRNSKRINGPEVILSPNTFRMANGQVKPALAIAPVGPIEAINATGIGPTYKSKVARFSLPQEYGAIDTRCVRVFGQGDPSNQQHNWLQLSVRNDGYGWYINANQAHWPKGYGTWIQVLRFFASALPANCPHPAGFVGSGMRLPGNAWSCADVEMALFTYASQFLYRTAQQVNAAGRPVGRP